MRVTINVPEFEGYEFVGHVIPADGQYFLSDGLLWESSGATWPFLTYRKLIKYREPTQADVGKMVEVRDYDNESWMKHKLLAMFESHISPYVAEVTCKSHASWRQARIVDDGTPKAAWTGAGNVGKVPREVWVNLYPGGSIGSAIADKERAIAWCGDRGETVHFREVME
jgi:hypothetical protein